MSVIVSRRRFIGSALRGTPVLVLANWATFGGPPRLAAAEPLLAKGGALPDLIHPPADPASWPAWREQLVQWRERARGELGYNDRLYTQPQFQWASSAYCCAFLMMCDPAVYDPRSGRYRIEELLAAGKKDFGGFDSILLWHAYPRIGFDDRNQFDFYRDMPGGLSGLRKLARACHRRGVKVFVDYNPWDTGTRREKQPDIDALAELVAAVEADGIFLDTMNRGAAEFRSKLDRARPGVVLEGEGALPMENIHDHHISWAQGFRDAPAPGVLRNKWFERRHLQHQIARWSTDHSAELHSAWMNGSGMLVWENVFGSFVGWSPRDRSILRSMLPIQRRFTALFQGEQWTPLVPTRHPDLYASLWAGPGLQLWTLVNRSNRAIEGPLMEVPAKAGGYFDLVQGCRIDPVKDGSRAVLAGAIPPRGIGAILAADPAALGSGFDKFLKLQAQLAQEADWSTANPVPATEVSGRPPVARSAARPDQTAMVRIPAAKLEITAEFRSRECGFYDSRGGAGSGINPLHQPRLFTRAVQLNAYAIDLAPVTNAEFHRFLKASRYRPRHPENFLKHWLNDAPPPGQEEHPVVYVDLNDARAYAAWAGKRLPTEEEWQYAAEGPERRLYPWGHEFRPGLCNDGRSGGTTPVRSFPEGCSPFGCFDMCGNTWELTESERSDGHTRFCVLKGGSWYRARGSDWYADGGPKPARFAAKYLLMWPGLDRCSTIGFRCAVDV